MKNQLEDPFCVKYNRKNPEYVNKWFNKKKKTIIKLDCIITHKCTGTNTGIQLYNAVINKEYTLQQLKQRAVNDKLT